RRLLHEMHARRLHAAAMPSLRQLLPQVPTARLRPLPQANLRRLLSQAVPRRVLVSANRSPAMPLGSRRLVLKRPLFQNLSSPAGKR
ncbi:MAG: hypothetical protein AAGD11_18830, partial [Planctomycetota bacterium]